MLPALKACADVIAVHAGLKPEEEERGATNPHSGPQV